MNHYFDDTSKLKSERKTITFDFHHESFQFILDNGVFSKSGIDIGSRILLEYIIKQPLGCKILDVGCGYGTIGIILKRFFASSSFQMVDVNPRALSLAQENAQINHSDVSIYQSDVYERVVDNDFNDIITNPPIRAGKQVIYKIFEQAYKHLQNGGQLWVVIRKSHGADSAKKKIMEVFGNCEVVKKDKGFYILNAKKNLTI